MINPIEQTDYRGLLPTENPLNVIDVIDATENFPSAEDNKDKLVVLTVDSAPNDKGIYLSDGTDWNIFEGTSGADGNGIASITLISTVGLDKTYRISFTDGSHFDYVVSDGADGTNGTNGTNGVDGTDGTDGTDGNGIVSVTLISTVGLVKTYQILFTDTTTFDYAVTDGADGTDGANIIISLLYSDLATLISTDLVNKGYVYFLTDKLISVQGLTNNKVSLEGSRVMEVVKNSYYTPSTVSGTPNKVYGGVYGKEMLRGKYPVSDAVNEYYCVYGGKAWKRDTSGADEVISDSTLSGWTIETDSIFYEEKTFFVLYDFANDWVVSQQDNRGNKLGTGVISSINPCNISDWGNENIYNNTCYGVYNNTNPLIYDNNCLGVIANNGNSGFVINNLIPDDNTSWFDTVGDVTTSLGKIVPSSTIFGWNKGASFGSIPISTDGYVEFNPVYMAGQSSGGRANFGLTDVTTGGGFTSIDFSIFLENDGTVQIYESGSWKGYQSTWTLSDTFAVERVGTTVYYKKNGTIFYTSLNTNSNELFFDCSLNRYLGAENIYIENYEVRANTTYDIHSNSNLGGIYNNTNFGDILNNSNSAGIHDNYNLGYIKFNNNSNSIYNNSNNGNIFHNSNDSSIYDNSNNGDIEYNNNSGKIFANSNSGRIIFNSNHSGVSGNSNNGSIEYNSCYDSVGGNTNNGNINYNSCGKIGSNDNDGDIYNNSCRDILANTSNGSIESNGNNGQVSYNLSDVGTTFNITNNYNNGGITYNQSTANCNIEYNTNNGSIGTLVGYSTRAVTVSDVQLNK